MNRTSKDIAQLAAASAPRILIVEDEADLALLISYNLEAEGYVVETVARGDEAALRLAETRPISSSWTGCCPACRASRFAGGCGRARRPAHCQ